VNPVAGQRRRVDPRERARNTLEMPSRPKTQQSVTLVGIAGGSGSGKSTLARHLLATLPPHTCQVIQHDWYYRDRGHLDEAARAALNFDEPAALDSDLLATHLTQLKQGVAVECPQYDFVTHTRGAGTTCVSPCRTVVVEGLLLFAEPQLYKLFDLRIFVDTADDIRLLRRFARDVTERGRSVQAVADQYLRTVRPMHHKHVAPSKQAADFVVPEGGRSPKVVDVIAAYLQSRSVPQI